MKLVKPAYFFVFFGKTQGRKIIISKKGVFSMYLATFILLVVGALNWLLVGLFQYDLVAALLGGASSPLSRIVYSVVGLAGAYGLFLLISGAAIPEESSQQ